jgi:hypothetical protein
MDGHCAHHATPGNQTCGRGDCMIDAWCTQSIIRESQWRSGSASDSNAKGAGFAARQGQEFSSSYETPELLVGEVRVY